METKEKLKRILLEWSAFKLPKLYRRDFDNTLLEGHEILSIIGARRTGKTFLCYQLIQQLREKLPSANVVYINFEDERLYPLKGDELTLLWEVYLELFSVELHQKIYLFIDEIQNVKNWSKWARRITEQNRNLKLIITGSSSKLLSREMATELRGRTLNFLVYPLSFREYLKAKGIDFEGENILYSPGRITLKKQFNSYVKMGGFAAILETSQPENLLKEYYQTMFYRDLVERYKIKNIKLFEDYLTLLMDQTACHFSISSTAKKLEEFGYSFSKNTLSNFLRYAQEIFLLFEVKQYRYKLKEQLNSPRKIYPIDHGLFQAIRFSFSEDLGRLLECISYLALHRKGSEIYYHKKDHECDFVILKDRRITQAIQVTKSISNAKTKKREVEGLLEALSQYQLKEGLILTEDDEPDTLKIGKRSIRVLPLWYWLLQ